MLILALVIFLVIAGDWRSSDDATNIQRDFSPKTATKKEFIRILSWNIAYGYGDNSAGHFYKPKEKTAYTTALEQISQLIKEERIDLALFQEIDRSS